MAFIHPNGITTIQAGQVIPGTVIHTPGVVQYVGQPLGSPSNQWPQNPQRRLWEKLYKAETKTLGAIQILIGLMHIGFGGASFSHIGPESYFPFTTLIGYPFWGGLFFIISGSLSVSAENQPNPCLVRCSVGFNITSSILTLLGIISCIVELAVLGHLLTNASVARRIGSSIAILLLLFSLLEFCISVSTAHFGCQAACCINDTPMVLVPYGQNVVIPIEGSLNPPASSKVDSSSVREAEEGTQETGEGQ